MSTLSAYSQSTEPPLVVYRQHPFKCPLTREYMQDPVWASDDTFYERSAIVEYVRRWGRSPKTGLPMSPEFVDCPALRRNIRDVLAMLAGIDV